MLMGSKISKKKNKKALLITGLIPIEIKLTF
jgi:hypothetical protein